MADSPDAIFGVFHNADLRFPAVTDGAGAERPLTDATFVPLLQSGDRTLRRNAFETYYVGKRGGAYSSGIARPHPYVLLNQTDDLDSQFTIAHEMGHAMHSYLSCKHQPVCTSDYVIFVAEVASTCNEVLLMRHLLRKSTDRRERAYLINHFLDQFKGTVYRQTMFAEFERELGRMAERGETLTLSLIHI